MFTVAVSFGLLYRVVMPIERYLDEDEYIAKVFVEFETVAWKSSATEATAAGAFDGGSVLYVIREDSNRVMVRPFTISGLDSVWVNVSDIITYSSDRYRIWQYEEERRKYDLE